MAFFSNAYGTFTKRDHMWDHKTSLKKFKRTEIIQYMFSDPHKIKFKISNRKVSVESTNLWKL